MYCMYCGAQIRDDARFCTKCGKSTQTTNNDEQIISNDEQTVSSTEQVVQCTTEKKINKKKWIIVTLASLFGAILIGVVLITLLISSMYVQVDMSKLYYVEFSGLDGKGKATVNINEDEWMKIVGEIAPKNDSSKINVLARLQMLEYTLSKEETLSNGDEIFLTIEFNEEFFKKNKVKAINLEQSILVDGLVVPKKIDVFEGLKIEFTGRNPYITCTLITKECNEFAKEYVDFTYEKNPYYRIGDVIEITAEYSSYSAEVEQVEVIETTKEFIVTDTGEAYVESLDEIDITGLQQAMYEQLQLECSAATDEFCGMVLYRDYYCCFDEIISEEQTQDAFMVLKNRIMLDEVTPYNMYIMTYRMILSIYDMYYDTEPEFYEMETDVVLIATNLYVDENGELHYDDLVSVEAQEVINNSNIRSIFIKEHQEDYQVILLD